MEDLRALSPGVRQLFEAVKSQVKDFNLAFELLARELKSLDTEKNALRTQSSNLQNLVNEKIINLEDVHQKAIDELDHTTQKALSLHGELKQVQDIRLYLEALSKTLDEQSATITGVINDFKYKSDKELNQAIDDIQHKVVDELDKEAQKIEVRLSIKQKQLEQKVVTTEQRIAQMSEGQKKDLKAMFSQVEDIRIESNRLKVITEELNRAQLIQTEDTEVEIERRYKALERLIHDLNKKVQEINSQPKASSGGSDEFGDFSDSEFGSLGSIASKLKSKSSGNSGLSNLSNMGGSTDTSSLAKDIKNLAKKVEELMQDRDTMQDKANASEKKGNLALWMAGISLVMVIVTLIITLTK